MNLPDLPVWPYPRWIAHRGAGLLAPENTLVAFRLGAAHGYRMFECDAKLSADGVVILLHDPSLDRTTNGTGLAADHPWRTLSQLDAGSWHSRAHAGEPLGTLESVSRWCRANGMLLNIEIKPSPGWEAVTGGSVACEAARLWEGAPVPPLLTSFQPEALAAAARAQPRLPRGLLLETWWPGWSNVARDMNCQALICQYDMWSGESVAQVHGMGMRALSYTVNDEWTAHWLLTLGTDGIITDRVDLFCPV